MHKGATSSPAVSTEAPPKRASILMNGLIMKCLHRTPGDMSQRCQPNLEFKLQGLICWEPCEVSLTPGYVVVPGEGWTLGQRICRLQLSVHKFPDVLGDGGSHQQGGRHAHQDHQYDLQQSLSCAEGSNPDQALFQYSQTRL